MAPSRGKPKRRHGSPISDAVSAEDYNLRKKGSTTSATPTPTESAVAGWRTSREAVVLDVDERKPSSLDSASMTRRPRPDGPGGVVRPDRGPGQAISD